MAPRERTYFAAAKRQDIGKKLTERLEAVVKDTQHDNRGETVNAYNHVYGRDIGYGTPTEVTRGGERGELANLRVNNATAFLRAKHAIVTGPKVNWRPIARNGDASSSAATSLAVSILEDEWKNNRLARVWLNWTHTALRFSEAFCFPEWDKAAGPAIMAMEGRLITGGALNYHVLTNLDVFRDNAAKSYEGCQYLYARLLKNRFDLARMTPRLADGRQGQEAEEAILSACDDVQSSGYLYDGRKEADSDLVPVWQFFHKPSASMPLGRHTTFINEKVVLEDKPLTGPNATYDELPLYRIAEQEMTETPHAWSSFWDTLGSQQISDAIHTALASTLLNYGNPSVSFEEGSELKAESLANGFQAFMRPKGSQPPEVIQLAHFPPDALKYLEVLAGGQQQGLGLNDVALGQPQSAQMNAQAFAVLASMAVQQATPMQEAAFTELARLGHGVLKTLCKRVTRERQLKVTGRSSKNLYSVLKYSGKDLKSIDGVQVDIGNPLEQTAAGRKTILDDKIKLGFVKMEEQYDAVLETGRSEPINRRLRDEMNLVEWEFEELQAGRTPPVHYIHNHVLHYRENSAALLTPAVQDSPESLAAVEAHLDEHYLAQFGVARAEDPMRFTRERFMLGQQVDPTQQMMPPPMGAPAGPPVEGGAPLEAMPMPPPGEGAPPGPAMPDNPVTGAPLDMANGPIA